MVIRVICYMSASFFAVYGLIAFFMRMISFDGMGILKDKKIYTVIPVKNAGEWIEGVLRAVISKNGGAKIIVVDTGSCDETGMIVGKISERRENIYFMTPEELNREIQR